MKRCIILFSKDYETEIVKNTNGTLCNHYPSEIVVLKGELGRKLSQNPPGFEDTDALRDLFASSRTARCRSRFVVPVILLNDHTHICRSATLSTYAELCGRQGYDWLSSMWSYGQTQNSAELGQRNFEKDGEVNGDLNPQQQPTDTEGENDRMTKTRLEDVKLLKSLRISLISDLMVENKKTKYFLTVSSSEKVDKSQRYADFGIASMPYPGCEFFKNYKSNNYNGRGLQFDWEQPEIDADFSLPSNLSCQESIDCKKLQSWDLIQITQNYLLILLSHLSTDNGGLLVHCISGWDRTPLFISLLRLSLWADGLIHQTLSPPEIIYLTLAYDWYLFGHQFHERLGRGEEILYFCFDFLQFLTDEHFSCSLKVDPSHWRTTECHRELSTVSPSSSVEDLTALVDGVCVPSHQGQTELTGNGVPVDKKASPMNIRKQQKTKDETDHSVGSWQILSLTDDVKDLVSGHVHTPPTEDAPPPSRCPITRKQKLEEARSLFVTAYQMSVPRTSINPPSGSGLGSFFNRLTGSLKLV
jgi:myotubularin-related protein 14